MAIWHKIPKLETLQELNKETAGENLGITYTEIGNNYLEATMPVDKRTKQPYGILHGGASALLIETLASVASSLVIDHEKYITVGMSLQADHLQQVNNGKVTGRAEPVRLGRKIHVWKVDIRSEEDKLVCAGKLTCMILRRK